MMVQSRVHCLLLLYHLFTFCFLHSADALNRGRSWNMSFMKSKLLLDTNYKPILEDSSNTQPYGVSSPFSLPPYDSLPPIPFPDINPPPFCVFPPFTPLPPAAGGGGSPPPSPPAPVGTVPAPPDQYVPIPSSPPLIIVPGPPATSYSPSPPPPLYSYVPITNPPPPPARPTLPLPPPYYEPSPPSYTVPSYPRPPTPGFSAPSPPMIFLPPIVYPPPAVPPPPHVAPAMTLWCVAKPSVPDPIIQEAMNYACASGAECDEIQPRGSCYEPNTLLAHASYAFNSYWQRTKVAGGTCEFGGTAMLVTVDPSYDGCRFIYF